MTAVGDNRRKKLFVVEVTLLVVAKEIWALFGGCESPEE